MYTLKKSLGQHFLTDESISQQIVDVLLQCPVNNLLEIGPGGGALTKYLLAVKDIHFKAFEIDEEKIAYLSKTYPQIQNKIIHADILKASPPFEKPFTIIGNFPYNISSQILFKILDWKSLVPRTIGMFQKEVALRIAASSGSKTYGILSVLVQAFYEVQYLFDVVPQSFNPPPSVMSGVIELIQRKDIPAMKSEKAFFNLVKLAFNQRRKMLRNAVKSLFSTETLQMEIFDKRAEQLSVHEFAKLTFLMNQ